MTAITTNILQEVLDELTTLSQDDIGPTDARERLRRLQQRHPHTNMELLWDEEPYDAAVHYDVLLRTNGQGTVSLSYCPDRVQPWPLRGVHRWSDRDLLRVNHTRLQVSQAVACLDFVWDQAPVVERLVNVCLIQEELEREPIELSDAELQLAMDGFRRARRLYTARDTLVWLQRRGITHVELEAVVSDEAIVAKLRRRIAMEHVEAYFEAHQADFDTVHIARVSFQTEEEARAGAELVRSGSLDFLVLAQRRFVGSMHARQVPVAFEVVRRRGGFAASTDIIMTARPGEVAGPFADGEGHSLALILAQTPAQLDPPTHDAIERLLFEKWLDERRAEAEIEWNWWNAARTRGASAAPIVGPS